MGTTVSDTGHHGESLSKQSSPTSSRLKVNETHQVLIRCVECKKNFVTAAALNDHLQTSSKHKKNPPKGIGGSSSVKCPKSKSYRCIECMKDFASMNALENHQSSSSHARKVKKNKAFTIDFECPELFCYYQCKRSKQAKGHLEYHGYSGLKLEDMLRKGVVNNV